MSETPIFHVPEYRGNLTDREIENPHEDYASFDLESDETLTPPVWAGPEVSHNIVQTPETPRLEAQPSVAEQHDAMTYQQNVDYIGTMTPYMAQVRSQYVHAA